MIVDIFKQTQPPSGLTFGYDQGIVFVSINGACVSHPQGVIANVLVMKDFTTRWPIGAWEKGLMSTDLFTCL